MLRALIKTMRPKQWAKNGFLFAAIVFDRQLISPEAFGVTLAGFALFCLLSSTVYILNDVADVEADRAHPTKRNRPIAAGTLPIPVARAVGIGLFIVLPVLAYLLSPGFAVIGVTYLLLNLVYSRWLKHIPLLDVLTLASFYVLRVAAGVTLIDVERFSPWLYLFTIFLALFLGVGKRRAELTTLAHDAANSRKVLDGYTVAFLDQLLMIVSSLTIMTYSLYTFSAPNLPCSHTMMLTIPFLIYGMFRYLYLVQVEGSGHAPEEVLFTDRPLQAALLLTGLALLAIFYLTPIDYLPPCPP
jgi:4-hydroxybenzoate polyprenyltransferase